MALIDVLICKLEQYFEHGELHITQDVFQVLVEPFRSKKSNRIPAKREQPRVKKEIVPKREIPAVQVFPDGREVCSDTHAGEREYKRRLAIMVDRQKNVCPMYGHVLLFPTFDHEDGRGMNGSHRDDRIWKEDGTPMNAALCSVCNTEKGSRRIPYKFQVTITRDQYEAQKGTS